MTPEELAQIINACNRKKIANIDFDGGEEHWPEWVRTLQRTFCISDEELNEAVYGDYPAH